MVQLNLIRTSLWRQRSLFLWWIFSLSITVTGLVIIDVYRASLADLLVTQGRKILMADVTISARRNLKDDEKAAFQKALPPETKISELTELLAMATSSQESRLVQIRFIDDIYPLAGNLQIEKIGAAPSTKTGAELTEAELWAAPDLEALMNLKLGDDLKIGEMKLKVSGFVRKDSSQTMRFGNFVPRVYIHRKHIEKTKLIQFGSTLTHQLLAITKLPPAKDLKSNLEKAFSDPAFQITVPTDLEQGSLSVLSRLLDYLGLTGLVTLTLGWIGVYYLGRRWLALELPVIGILKSLGFSSREMFRHLTLKLVIILFVSVLIGGTVAWLAAQLAFPLVKSSLPEDFRLVWSWRNTLLLLGIGPIAGLVLMLEPIYRGTTEGPLRLMYESSTASARWTSQLLLGLVVAALFLALTWLQARSFRITGLFVLCLFGGWMAMALLGWLWLKMTELFRTPQDGWAWHLASSIWLRRRGTSLLLLTVSALAGLLSQLVPHIQNTLVGELTTPESADRPALFMIDIQDEQLEPLKQLLAENKLEISSVSPFIRARILQVNNDPFERSQPSLWQTREEATNARFRNRGVNLSYREKLSPSESILAGKKWEDTTSDPAEISVEQSYAERMNLKIGDKLLFDVQGVEVQAQIVSLRDISWNSFEPNFFVQFKPGVFDLAPKTWILTVKRHPQLTPAQIQKLVTKKFSNVSSINLQEAVDNASELISKLSSGLKIASFLALTLGVLVFLTILVFQIQSSRQDWVQLRYQGLTIKNIQQLQFLAYGSLAMVGTILGSVLALAVNYGLATYALKTVARPDWLGGLQVAATTWLVLAVALYWIGKQELSYHSRSFFKK